jgi:non-specific serine/threonine protein kinase
VGKTRLALRVAEDLRSDYRDGVWLVDLAPLADAVLVPKALALALDVQEQPGRPLIDTLTDRLRRRQVLLVLDNCEHLVQACADLADVLLRSCASLRILATSRHVLRVSGERVWRVPSLQVPEAQERTTTDEVARTEAARLFAERARAVQPAFSLTDQNAGAVSQVCRQLDGIPLALELAAARMAVLSADQLAERLEDRFKLLSDGDSTGLPRHQTLYSTLDWSHELLSEPERRLFRRLAVFAGGWTLEAAEAVCADRDLPGRDVLDLLAALVGKSLVIVDARPDGNRYRFLETLRQYAFTKLRETDEDKEFCRRQRDWCIALVEEANPHLYRWEQVDWLDRLDREHGNLQAALAWSHADLDGGLSLGRLVKALGWFWYLRGHLNVGRPWLEQAVNKIEPESVRGGALLSVGWTAFGRGELEHAGTLCEESLACARASGDSHVAVIALTALSFTLRDRGQLDRSMPLLEESLKLAREIGFRWGEAFSLYLLNQEWSRRGNLSGVDECCRLALPIFRDIGERLGLAYTLKDLARLKFERGEYAEEADLEWESLALSRELGNRRGICFALAGLARDARRRGEFARAEDLLQEVLSIWYELGNRPHLAVTLTGLGALAAAQGNYTRAARLFGAAEVLRETVGAAISRPELEVDASYKHAAATARKCLGASAYAAALDAGRSSDLDEAVDAALVPSQSAGNRSERRLDGEAGRLSTRELEIASLIARGKSNREIASELVIAPRTVDTHVGHVLSKLGLRTRAQVAAWAVGSGLVAGWPNRSLSTLEPNT